MIIDQTLLDKLTAEAKASARLRMNYDLRNSEADGSQRMLNAIEPGSVVPVHRHRRSSETVREVDRKKKSCTFVFEMAISEIAVSELRV